MSAIPYAPIDNDASVVAAMRHELLDPLLGYRQVALPSKTGEVSFPQYVLLRRACVEVSLRSLHFNK